MAPTEDVKAKAELANHAAEEFCKLYYEHFDTRRHTIRKLYLDAATATWNGNVFKGVEAIMNHLEALPTSSHTITSLDAQPLIVPLMPNERSIGVTVFGMVKYHNNKSKAFTHNFMLTSQGTVWKVVSDVVRFLDQ